MFGYDRPSLKELLGYPFLIWVVALAICGFVPAGEWRELAQFGYVAVCINLAIVPSIYLVKQFSEMSESKSENTTPAEKPVKYLDLNAGQVYSQNVTSVKVDSIRQFNRRILLQKHEGFKVDMTENFWIKKGEWQKIGGAGKSDWSDMIQRGIKHGVYAEQGLQRKRVVADWNKVRRLERGEPLPL
jgi:hypothetical protein